VSEDLGGLAFHDRVFVAGQTRSGKSELLNVLFSMLNGQRLLLDTKPEFAIADVEPVSDPAAIDWGQQTIHYVPTATGGPAEIDELFKACHHRRRLTVCCHELADLCDFQPNRTPAWLNAYISKGGALGNGFYCGSQRPVQVPTRALTEAQHVFHVVPRLTRRSDVQAVAEPMGLEPDELAGELAATEREYGRHSFLWWDVRAQQLTKWAPLPDDLRARNIVERTIDHA
jgi:hypothetical protein